MGEKLPTSADRDIDSIQGRRNYIGIEPIVLQRKMPAGCPQTVKVRFEARHILLRGRHE